MTGDDDEMFTTISLIVTPKTTERHLIARSLNVLQLTKLVDYRLRHQSVDDLTAIGSVALVVLATAGSTNSVRTISAHLPTYGEQPSGVVILERRYGPRRLRDDDDDDDFTTYTKKQHDK